MAGRWLELSACDLGRRIGAGEIDPAELAEEYIEAISSHPAADSIYSGLTKERARAEAAEAAARARAGLRLSPLDGVPISWKDLYDTAGAATEAGSALLKGRIPSSDAEVIRIASSAGLVCLGKTHMSELAFSGLGMNPVTSTPPCVNDPDRVPGGSSSGAAASVAFRLAAAAVGSDTGGSVRIPAAWNDIVGLKTTSGLISLDGVVPLCPSFDTVGPLAKNVEDAAALFAVLAGLPAADLAGASLAGCRFLLLEGTAMEELDEGPQQALRRAVDCMKDAGAAFESAPLPAVEDALLLAGCLYCVEAYAIWKDEIEASPELMFAPVRDRFLSGREYSGADFVRAWRRLRELRAQFRAATAGFDAVVAPANPTIPPVRDQLLEDHEYYVQQNLLALRNTRIANLMEAPALTVPTGIPSSGIMLVGQPFREGKILRIGKALEKALS